MELKHYIQMLQRGWWIVALTTLLAVNIALIASYATTPTYRANAKFIISPSPEIISGRDVVTSLEALDKRSIISTYAEFLNSRKVYLEALAALGLQESQLRDYRFSTVVLPDANIIELSVLGPNPELAALLANTLGQRAIANISLIYRAYDISVLDSAVAPLIAINPQPIRDTSLAIVLGLIGGSALAILSEQIRVPLETYRMRRRIDPVTGVFNARYFRQLLEDELIQHPDDLLSIGIVELGSLQEYLDTLPPMAMQRVLLKVTDILRKELRGNDIVGRWTESSFIIMLPATSGAATSRTFDRIQQALSLPIELEQYGVILNLDPHLGGSVYSNNITSHELLSQAEASVEQARRDNTNQIYIWEMKKPFWSESDSSEA